MQRTLISFYYVWNGCMCFDAIQINLIKSNQITSNQVETFMQQTQIKLSKSDVLLTRKQIVHHLCLHTMNSYSCFVLLLFFY